MDELNTSQHMQSHPTAQSHTVPKSLVILPTIAVSLPLPLLENGLNTSRILPVKRYDSDLAFGDTPTEFKIRLAVDSGTASFEAYGVAGGYPFTNAGQSDQAFSGTLDRTFLVDADRESRFDVFVRADTPGAQLSCELTQGGVVFSQVTGTDSINCRTNRAAKR